MIPPGWADLPFFSDVWPEVFDRLRQEKRDVLPPDHLRFAALERTAPDATRVVILGQDPYPTPGHANGLAFSVTPKTKLPASLRNIFKEMEDDIGGSPANGDLGHWADQGVLLLNTALSVPAGDAGGHAKIGWNALTRDVLKRLSVRPCAYVLWGNHAQGFEASIGGEPFIVKSAHPSPLAARRGFFGSRPFSQVNQWLASRGESPINWSG